MVTHSQMYRTSTDAHRTKSAEVKNRRANRVVPGAAAGPSEIPAGNLEIAAFFDGIVLAPPTRQRNPHQSTGRNLKYGRQQPDIRNTIFLVAIDINIFGSSRDVGSLHPKVDRRSPKPDAPRGNRIGVDISTAGIAALEQSVEQDRSIALPDHGSELTTQIEREIRTRNRTDRHGGQD